MTEDFVKEIERRILTGQWPIGMRLPASRELAEEFMVSRSVINAGISELCSNGYLKTVPRKDICVSNWKETGGFALLRGLMEQGLWDVQFFDDILESRMNIGKATAIKAAAARTEEDLARLRSAIDAEKSCHTALDRARADREFHCAIAAASHKADAVSASHAGNSGETPLTGVAMEIVQRQDCIKFLDYEGKDSYPRFIPLLHAIPVGPDRFIFADEPHGEDVKAIPAGAKVTLHCISIFTMESVQFRGIYQGICDGIGAIDVKLVYNPMIPRPSFIYPRTPYQPVTEF